MTKDEALKLALEALEFIPKSGSMLGTQAEAKRLQAIAALQEELTLQQLSKPCLCGKQTMAWCMANTCSKAQPEQEPVACVEYIPCCTDKPCSKCKAAIKPELVCVCGAVWEGQELIYTTPQRTWVGLTDEEVESYWDWEDFQCGCGQGTLFEMVRDIEAKLKEKNT